MFRPIRLLLLCGGMASAGQLVHAQAMRPAAAPPSVQGSTILQPPDEVLLPPVKQHRTVGSPTIPRTIAELNNEVHRFVGIVAQDWLDLSKVSGPPLDSVRVKVKQRAQQLVQTVAWDTVRGLQADAGIVLLIRAGDTARASTLIERRLAERGLSLMDSAFVLFTAANAYMNVAWPVDFVRAEAYSKRLDALPTGNDFRRPGAGYWQGKAHLAMGMQHYYLNHTDDVFAHLRQFLTIVSRMDYFTRLGMIEGSSVLQVSPETTRFWDVYAGAFDLSHGLPDGAARMEVLNKQLLGFAPPPAALMALDTARWKGVKDEMAPIVKSFTQELSMYGKRIPPMPGEVWLNTPDSAAHTVSFGDGNVYIVAHTIKCTYVPEMAKRFERVVAAVPGVKVILRCRLSGYWGNVFLTPAEELAALKAKFARELHTPFPVSVWVGEKVRTRGDGYVISADPTGETVFADRYVLFIDKQGRSRMLVSEYLKSPGHSEEQQIRLMRRLMAEPAGTSSTAAPSAIPSATSPAAVSAGRS
jgi:hypothetical protein